MKNLYVLILLVFISCTEKTKEKKKSTVKIQDTAAVLIDSIKTIPNLSFNTFAETIKTRSLPLIEATNFDSFIEAEDYNSVNVKMLKLEEIYPQFYKERYNYRAISNYKLELSKKNYSIIVTVLKGEHEMETRLINYDLKGNLIASKVISYDEIAESMLKIESRIRKNTITTNHISWDLVKEIEQERFMIKEDGTIAEIDSEKLSSTLKNYTLILDVLEQIGLSTLDVKTDLIVSKTIPQSVDETIVVIPEISREYDAYHFELNTHIVLINNHTGKISNQYFESTKNNNWISDALQLKELKIDTAPYKVAENVRAFGIRVYYYGSSQVNPYSNEKISLFINSGKTLKKVLSNYNVMNYGGEWNTDCVGEFLGSKAILALSSEKTNGYFDIKVRNTNTEIKNYVDENGDCKSTDEITTETSILKFNGTTYKKE